MLAKETINETVTDDAAVTAAGRHVIFSALTLLVARLHKVHPADYDLQTVLLQNPLYSSVLSIINK